MKQYLAIDIGGTAVKLGIVDEEGRVLSKTEQSVCFDNYETPILTTVLSAAEQFLKEQAVEPQGLAGIGVSATGQIDSRKGIVAGTCGSLPNYIGSPIKAELEAKFGLPTTVANDANCMTLGEVWVGGAKGYTDVIGVTLGTGVGGGILTGGRLLEGARGLGGELGHFRTHALNGVFCTCGASGCWERYAATTALVRGAQPRNPKWKDGRAIFESAHAGDPTILALLDDWTDEIAQGLAGMVHIFNPQLILIGGGVSAQQELLIDPVAKESACLRDARFCGRTGDPRRPAPQRRRHGGRSLLFPPVAGRDLKGEETMKKHILCLGDSNTHGYCADPADCADHGIRFNEDERWTCRLQTALGSDYLVTEEGLSGRTTVFVDPIHESMDALSVAYSLLKSHEVIDLLIIMLGTNDVKERFNANAACIGAGMERLILKAKSVDCWGTKAPNILVVAPPRIGDGFHDAVMGEGCVEKSKGVAEQFRIVAERQNVHFLNAADCEFNQVDFMHLTRKGHAQLADLLAKEVPTLL